MMNYSGSKTKNFGSITSNSQFLYKERILEVLQKKPMTQAEIQEKIEIMLPTFSRNTLSTVLSVLISDEDL